MDCVLRQATQEVVVLQAKQLLVTEWKGGNWRQQQHHHHLESDNERTGLVETNE